MPDDTRSQPPVRERIRALLVTGASIIAAALLALIASQFSGVVAAVGIGALILFASFAVGGVLGFIFGVPRVLTKDKGTTSGTLSAEGSTPQGLKRRLLNSNTNLEQVSDWLTTMIVGVALTQLNGINQGLYAFRVYLRATARVFPDRAGGDAGALPSVGPMLLILGLVLGFLFLYLYTRINLAVLLSQVERDLDEGIVTGDEAKAVRDAASKLSGIAESPRFMALARTEEPSVDDSIDLMGSMLYQPGRYQDVIELGGKLSATPATRKAEYWLYLAAAFGQKHHVLLQNKGSPEDLASARDNALDCARRAVAINPSIRSTLRFISDPEGQDDDLADFRDDADFQAIVGKRGHPTARPN